MRKNKFNANMRKNMRYALCMKIRALTVGYHWSFDTANWRISARAEFFGAFMSDSN